MPPERQSYDGELSGIRKSMETMAEASMKTALHVERISTRQEVYIEQITICSKETKQNAKNIIELNTKYDGHEKLHKVIKQVKDGAMSKGRWCADNIRSWVAVIISAVIAVMFFFLKFSGKSGGNS